MGQYVWGGEHHGGQGEGHKGGMDTHDSAAGDPPDGGVFGPIEDGEEVFEWIDDGDDRDGPHDRDEPAEPPSRTFRERLAAVRASGSAGGRRLRRSRREIVAGAAAIVLACAVGGACTAWFDAVAGAADRADVVSLAVDSVVDGDPAAGSYDAGTTTAVGQYVLELANNSPDAVTLADVDVDAGTLMTSTGWKPVGPSTRIPGGGTAKVALTVKLFCPMVTLGVRTGMLSAAPGIGGGSGLPFPAVHVRVEDGDGDPHDLVLPTRVSTSAQLGDGLLAFRSTDGLEFPEIVSADAGVCDQYVSDTTDERLATVTASRFPSDIVLGYDKVLSSGTDSFVLGFTVKNTGGQAKTLTAHNGGTFLEDQVRTVWLPSVMQIAPGQSVPARLTIHIQDCDGVLSGAPVLGETVLQINDADGGSPQPVFMDQAMTGSLRLAGDIVQQEKAACG